MCSDTLLFFYFGQVTKEFDYRFDTIHYGQYLATL